MKLYDVIRKEEIEEGRTFPPINMDREHSTPKPHRPRHSVRWRSMLVIALAVVFVAVLYIVGMKVVHARVVINERRIPFSLEGAEFELSHEGEGSVGRLSFQTMVVPTQVSRQVYGSVVEPSTSSATGKVVFFNEYSTKPQTIKAKTVITSKEGKKYQTTTAVTVPGYTLKNKVKTAGTSASVSVKASGVGPTYNTTGTSFTVAGYSKTLYAQSAGAISGGEDGIVHRVAPSEQESIRATLQAQLIERLKRETRAQMPQGFITFPDLQVTTLKGDAVSFQGDSIKFAASMDGVMVTYLIPIDLLESTIANHFLTDDHTYPQVTIPDLGGLTVVPVTSLPADPSVVPDSIRVRVSGEGTIIAKAPLDTIRQSLVGIPKTAFATTLATVPEIDTAEYHFTPFWAPFFPSRESRIKVEVR